MARQTRSALRHNLYKTDKLSATAVRRNIDSYRERLLQQWENLPPIFASSSEKGTGRDEILEYIDSVNRAMEATPSATQS